MFEKGNLRDTSQNQVQEAILPMDTMNANTAVVMVGDSTEGMSNQGVEEVLERLEKTTEAMEQLGSLFQARLSYDANQEKVIDQMHEELQRYKNDLFGTLIRPILVDIIEVVDSIRKTGEAYASRGDVESEASKLIVSYIEDLHNVLASYNVEVYKGTAGDGYTPIRQRIVSCVTTGDMALNGKLVESLGFGYTHNGKVIWAEKVKVYKYQLM